MARIEVDADNLESWLAHATSCTDVVFAAVDLRPYDDHLADLPQARDDEEACVFLGCHLGPRLAAACAESFAIVFPVLPGRLYDAYRRHLYRPTDLFDRFDPADPASYHRCMDWLNYVGYLQVVDGKPVRPPALVPVGPDEILARRLHDHHVDEALDRFLLRHCRPHRRGVVAIMGGHDTLRSDPVFLETASLARDLTRRGFLVATGGGPGLMEAANLGAYLADHAEPDLAEAVAILARAPKYDHPEWLARAFDVRHRFAPSQTHSLGLPTWWYGHEPPNAFASHIAKYFENSMREEGLLAIATHGIVFAAGNAGTVQEIFQDACQNYYDTYGHKSPMILFGADYWNPSEPGAMSKPAWPLLQQLAREKRFEHLITLTSDPADVLAAIERFDPGV